MKQPATGKQTSLPPQESPQDLAAWLRATNLASLYNSIAHELRGPLNAMSINLEMLKFALGDPLKNGSDKPEHYIRILSESIRQLDQRLLLFFGHFGANTRQPLPLQKLLTEIEELSITQAHTQSVRMKVMATEENPVLQDHVPEWRQAALHLVVHALTELGRGDEIVIETACSGPQLKLRVCDSAALAKTSSPAMTPGLSKVSALATLCGGKFSLYGNPGNKSGACRELIIPLNH
jgi:signal transduction histidine kinase